MHVASLRPIATTLAAALTLGACRAPERLAYACTGNIVPAVIVTIRDFETGAPAARDAEVLIVDQAFRDSSRMVFDTPETTIAVLADRAGTYDVTVRKSGYRDWTLSGVQVTADQCHVHTVFLTALLKR